VPDPLSPAFPGIPAALARKHPRNFLPGRLHLYGEAGKICTADVVADRASAHEQAEALALDAEGDVELAAGVGSSRNPAYLRVVPLQNAADYGAIRNPGATTVVIAQQVAPVRLVYASHSTARLVDGVRPARLICGSAFDFQRPSDCNSVELTRALCN
jgi:hypothetical protein